MLLLYRLLRRKKYRQRAATRFDAANPPKRMRWRPKLSVFGLLSGAVGGLGAVILLAQYGIEPVSSRALSMRGAIGAGVAGIGVPSLVFTFVVWRFNKKLAAFTASGAGMARAAGTMVLGVPVAVVGMIVLLGGTAPAVNGPCVAQFAGVDVAGRTTTVGDAIEVQEDGHVDYFMRAPEDLQTWRFSLVYGPYEQLIAEGDADEQQQGDLGLGLEGDDDFLIDIDFSSLLGAPVVDGNSVAGSVATDEYAWMGVGLYEVHGEVTTVGGTSCSGVILIDVQGNPLETVAGMVAAGMTALGAVGAAVAGIGAAVSGGEALDALDHWIDEQGGGDGGGPPGDGSVPPGPGDGGGGGATTTVVLTGDAARDVLAQGVGASVPLDTPDQYDTYVEAGGSVATGNHLGTHGTVTGIGAVVESEDGEIAVSVDVATFTPSGGASPPGTDADVPLPPVPTVPPSTPVGGSEVPAGEPSPAPADEAGTEVPEGIIIDELFDDSDGVAPAGVVPVVPVAAGATTPSAPSAPTVPASAAADDAGDGAAEPPPDATRLDPQVEFDVGERMTEEVKKRLDEGYYVRNPNLIVKIWNNFIRDPIWWNDKTGQCGDFADFGAEWSRPWLTEMLGEGTVVDSIGVVEKSTINPQGVVDYVDGLVPVGHAATRVIAPDGQRYILDYWEYMGRMEGVPARLIPESEWLEKWMPAAGSEAEYMRTFDELSLKEEITKYGEEDGIQRYLARKDSAAHRQTIVNSWRAEPW